MPGPVCFIARGSMRAILPGISCDRKPFASLEKYHIQACQIHELLRRKAILTAELHLFQAPELGQFLARKLQTLLRSSGVERFYGGCFAFFSEQVCEYLYLVPGDSCQLTTARGIDNRCYVFRMLFDFARH